MAHALGWGAQTGPFRPSMRMLFRRRIAIVFYHGVWAAGSGDPRRFGGLEIDAFRRDMELFTKYFRFVPLDVVIGLTSEATIPDEPVIAVTFDDGLDMFLSGAVDVLAEFGIPATMFIVTKCVGNQHLMWIHKFFAAIEDRGADRFVAAYNQFVENAGIAEPIDSVRRLSWSTKSWPMRLKDQFAQEIYDACDMPPVDEYLQEHRPYITWPDLQEWRHRGHSIGLHSHSHPFCSMLDPSELEAELIVAARALREQLSLGTLPFAYPFGDRIPSRRTESEICSKAGFNCMLGVEGLNALGASPVALERVDAESGLGVHMFAKPILSSWKRSLSGTTVLN